MQVSSNTSSTITRVTTTSGVDSAAAAFRLRFGASPDTSITRFLNDLLSVKFDCLVYNKNEILFSSC